MKIAVILGSPTGANSVTRQYVRFLQQQRPDHTFELLDVGRGTRRLERDRERFDALTEPLVEADGVLWAFPVYTFLAPAGLVRFVELLFERLPPDALDGKLATTLTTSEHFYDHTAHRYMEEVSEDLGMGVLTGFSADMEDILTEDGRQNLLAFVDQFLRGIEERAPMEVHHPPVVWRAPDYTPTPSAEVEKTGAGRVTVITDATAEDVNLTRMIEVFCRHSAHPVDVLNLREIGMKGGCMGCLQCVYDGHCVYKDGFAEAFDQRIQTADVLVFAVSVRQRYLSSICKMYFDRNFRNGHRPILHGKPMGWIVSGPLRQLPNLRQILESKGEVQRSPRLGIVTDEYGETGAISARLEALAVEVDRRLEQAWIRPATFLGVGGRKIFRDLMYAMRGIMRADHAYYRREGLYDFPQRDLGRTVFNGFMTVMMWIPWTRRWTLRKMGEFKLTQIRKIVEP
jgi:NAD(P)H-dependent FMN reductase